MYNHLVLSIVISAVPIFAFAFIGALLLQKFYVKIRSKYNATVNCWFCNKNTSVPYVDSNSWTCPHCEQYNGFTKDGDYNREMFQQLDCSNASRQSSCFTERNFSSSLLGAQTNGLCHDCNEAQRLKVEKLAQFQPKRESRFDAELKIYKAFLEDTYRLCATCENHLHKVLREKKKMILGSKFLAFILKSAETFRKPHFEKIRLMYRQEWKQRLIILITFLTVTNMFCLYGVIPPLTREKLTTMFGESLGQQLFIYLSHLLALGRVLSAYFERIGTHPGVAKFNIFVRTIFMMMLYTLGLSRSQIAHLNFYYIYVLFCPFALLGLTFIYNIVDAFKLTRFTFLLALWSCFAGGLIEEQFYFSPNTLMFISSVLTLALSLNTKVHTSLNDSSNSFHKIYTEDYFSDDDTISLLSQQLNTSTTCSNSMNSTAESLRLHSTEDKYYNSRNTSFTPSLNNRHIAPNLSNTSRHSQYASSLCDFNTTVPKTLPSSSQFIHNSKLNGLASPYAKSVFGSSFSEQMDTYPLLMQTNNRATFRKNDNPINTSLQHSPFSLTKGVEYERQHRVDQARNLLTPSRLNAAHLTHNGFATAWVTSDEWFSQRTNTAETRTAASMKNGNISRGSSQSSGFESQNDRPNVSRENSTGADVPDSLQRTKVLDTAKTFQPINPNVREKSYYPEIGDFRNHTKSLDAPRAFQPIDANVRQPFSSRSSLFTHPTMSKPSTTSWVKTSDFSTPFRRSHFTERDSFNLHKINEELPIIKPGDLLKKWKESQKTA